MASSVPVCKVFVLFNLPSESSLAAISTFKLFVFSHLRVQVHFGHWQVVLQSKVLEIKDDQVVEGG